MFVVTLPPSARKNPRAFALKAKKAGADILEIRGDLTPRVPVFQSPLPLLVSPRGHGIKLIESLEPDYVDFDDTDTNRIVSSDFKKILSFHDYKRTPSLTELTVIVRTLALQKPWMIKIATTIRTYDDLVTLEKVRASFPRRRLTMLGMGDKAHLTRALSPSRNVFTYTYLDGEDSAAAGQLPLSFYRLCPRGRNPALFGIIGGPHITASLSPVIHNALFRRHKVDAVYSCFPTDDFASTITALRALGVVGLSVTAPFKHNAFEISRMHEPIVDELGVANTLVWNGSKCSGFNSDIAGIRNGYPQLQNATTIAILGAGGAVPAAIGAIKASNPKAEIIVFARDTTKACVSLARFDVEVHPLSAALKCEADIVLCAVSADVALPLPKPRRSAVAIDFRYGTNTAFLRAARKQGYRTLDGIPMLIHQALKQFRHFTGKKPKADDAKFLQKLLPQFLKHS